MMCICFNCLTVTLYVVILTSFTDYFALFHQGRFVFVSKNIFLVFFIIGKAVALGHHVSAYQILFLVLSLYRFPDSSLRTVKVDLAVPEDGIIMIEHKMKVGYSSVSLYVSIPLSMCS